MIGFTTSELAGIRTIANQALPDTATIYRRTLTDDLRGGKLAEYVQDLDTVKCRIAFFGGRPVMPDTPRGSNIEAAERYLVTFPLGTNLAGYDRFSVKEILFEIISAADDPIASEFLGQGLRSFQTVIRLLAKRVI